MSEAKKGMSRRDFGKITMAGATAAAGFGIVRNAAAADPLKIALIGAGGRGTGAVQDAMKASDNIQLIGIADVMEQKAKDAYNGFKNNANLAENIKMTEETVFGGLDAYQKVIDLQPDYVIIATPPGFRPIHFEAVVEKKLNCFCEKPVATDSNGIRRYMAAARKSERLGLNIVVGTQRRHEKTYLETIQKIHDGALGEIVAGRAYWNGTLPHRRERKPGMDDLTYQLYNWYNFCWICGDNIVEQHVHNLDVMNWVFQAHPISVVASGGRAQKPPEERYGNIWDHFNCDFEYPNGVHVLSSCRHWDNCDDDVSELVTGTNRAFRNGQSNCSDMASERGINPYVQEHADLQASIRGTGPKLNEAMQVAVSTFTAIFGRMSAYMGKKLSWDEALNMDYDIFPKNMDWGVPMPPDPIPVPGTKIPGMK